MKLYNSRFAFLYETRTNVQGAWYLWDRLVQSWVWAIGAHKINSNNSFMKLCYNFSLVVTVIYSMSCLLRPMTSTYCYQKTAWLGMFYMCIPTGIALGYVYGGLVSLIMNSVFLVILFV